jgi:glycosyltransferase involved in cell wall biosynthesis
MRIVIDIRRLKDFGVGTYIRNLVPALALVDKSNEYVLVRTPADEHEFADLPENFKKVVYDKSDDERMDNLAFPNFLRKMRPTLTHIPVSSVPLLMPKPYIVTTHDLSSLFYTDARNFTQAFRRFRFRRGLLAAARVIVVSAATRRDVENLIGVPPERIRLVHNAPNPEFFKHRHVADARVAGPDAEARERQRILERYQIHYPFLLYAGSIRPQKNIPRLVEAFAVTMEEMGHHPDFKDLRLIIIGDEISRHPSVRRAVIQSRVEDRVRFLGFVPFDTLRVFYESAIAFVFPSLYEGFGLPPLEAMASGTPVITSASSSLPEVVGGAAMLVNPENVFDIARGIKEVLCDPEMRRHMSESGKRHAARYSWESTAREVLDIYREVGRGNS